MSDTTWSDYDFTQIPFERIERVGQISLLQKDLFCVSWILGRFCNYSCSYCWPYASTKKKDHRPTAVVLSTLDEIKRQARERQFNSFHFSFSGGEPTMHPGYLEILTHFSADQANCNYQSAHMTSNCSPGLAWLEKYVRATERLSRVSVTASFHSEFAKQELFAEKLIFLQQNKVQVTINMVMVPERFENLWQTALYFHERGINVTLKPQSNSNATRVVDGYSDEQLLRLQKGMPQRDYTGQKVNAWKSAPPKMQVELTDSEGKAWFMDQAERFNAFNFNRFQGWQCSAGYRSIVIREPDGSIKRSYSCHDQPLGHIETGFNLFPEPKVCITPSCVSSADSKIPKRKVSCTLPLWPEAQPHSKAIEQTQNFSNLEL